MITSSLKEKKTTTKQPNSASLSPQVILLVFSAQLSHTLLILWFPSFTVKEMSLVQLEKKWVESINKLDSKDFGLVS
jgi:hypothetical protein